MEERGMIQALHRQGLSLRRIAAEVGCAHTTVFYELRRGTPVRKSSRGRTPQYTAK
ncbi:helix-turn-helix domain-containing protein [Selenomonas sp.]|uniref:helix-turn-helix domain-containing protein n=1 Tax=Selenomonas sp. TaxID=2053611 RepID=UPI0025ED8F84|nr:helix-turn-helix domain-containing protein [Selenomonas sp.]